MGKEAIENSTREFVPLLEKCRSGQIFDNGYNLFIHGNILKNEGLQVESLGATNLELCGYLVEDLNYWLEQIRKGEMDIDEAFLSLELIDAYFTTDGVIDNTVLRDMGMTNKDFKDFVHAFEISTAKGEIAKCRTSGPSGHFYGVKQDLLDGTISLEEIDATIEEIDLYTKKYKLKHPHTHWTIQKQLKDKFTYEYRQFSPYIYLKGENGENILPDPIIGSIKEIEQFKNGQFDAFKIKTSQGATVFLPPVALETINNLELLDRLFITNRVSIINGQEIPIPGQKTVTVFREGKFVLSFGVETDYIILE